jgi:hypothetical protein
VANRQQKRFDSGPNHEPLVRMERRYLWSSIAAAMLLVTPVATSAAPQVKCSGAYTAHLSTTDSAVVVAVQPKLNAEVDRVLLRSPYKSEGAALPAQIGVNPDTHEAVASFELAAVRRLPASGFNIVITTPTGERICRVSRKQQAQLVHSE